MPVRAARLVAETVRIHCPRRDCGDVLAEPSSGSEFCTACGKEFPVLLNRPYLYDEGDS